VGGELAGHYYFRENYFCDSGMIAALAILEVLAADGRPFSRIIGDIRTYWFSGELNFTVANGEEIVRSVQADVIVGPNAFGGDGHPDHIRASQVARMAFERAGDPGAYPEQLRASELRPWTPAKLYEAVNQFGRREKLSRALADGGIRAAAPLLLRVARNWSPGSERRRREMAAKQRAVTTRVDVGPYLERKYAALVEHRTQIALDAGLFALSPAERRRVSPTEDFTLRESHVPVDPREDDLFAGLRQESGA